MTSNGCPTVDHVVRPRHSRVPCEPFVLATARSSNFVMDSPNTKEKRVCARITNPLWKNTHRVKLPKPIGRLPIRVSYPTFRIFSSGPGSDSSPVHPFLIVQTCQPRSCVGEDQTEESQECPFPQVERCFACRTTLCITTSS